MVVRHSFSFFRRPSVPAGTLAGFFCCVLPRCTPGLPAEWAQPSMALLECQVWRSDLVLSLVLVVFLFLLCCALPLRLLPFLLLAQASG
jgi:hypothetical protein